MTSLATGRFPRLADLPWNDLAGLTVAANGYFETLCADGGTLLRQLLARLSGDLVLHPLCERLDFMDKLVLSEDSTAGVRLRLHLFRAGYRDHPHDHRFTFASRILAGQYRHNLYGDDAVLNDPARTTSTALMTRTERPGCEYVLHHDAVHAVIAAEQTLSIVLRGPIVKSRSVILDPLTGERRELVSATKEPPTARAAKQLGRAGIAEVIQAVLSLLDAEWG